METKIKTKGLTLFLALSGIFVASLVACNLIFQKFFFWRPFTFLGEMEVADFTFEASVGLLAYPVTFLVTDLISELYGRKMANKVVFVGFLSAIFVYLLISISILTPATEWSPVGDEVYANVFGLTGPAIFASMCAYLIAQFIDIRIFHFWKQLTKGKKLWLRNNFSTIPSQFIDTAIVLILLCSFGKLDWSRFNELFINGFLYKVIFALVDTPILYFLIFLARKHFHISENEELNLV